MAHIIIINEGTRSSWNDYGTQIGIADGPPTSFGVFIGAIILYVFLILLFSGG